MNESGEYLRSPLPPPPLVSVEMESKGHKSGQSERIVPPLISHLTDERPQRDLGLEPQIEILQLSYEKYPSWLISLVLHLALLLLLALLPLAERRGSALNLLFGEQGIGGVDFDLGSTESFELDMPTEFTLESSSEISESQLIDIAELIQLDTDSGPLLTQSSISSMLSGRLSSNRASLLASGGGSAATEEAVELGLQWLASNQLSSGGWSLIGKYANGADQEDQTAATAMALNAFLGAGYTHQQGKYSQVVSDGLRFLLQRQSSNGFFANKEPPHHQAYAQAIATITVLEAYGLTGDDELQGPANLAVSYAEWAQSSFHGWRYQPRADADTSVTGWFVMALETARMVGLTVEESKLRSVHDYLDSVAHHDLSAYAYKERQGPDLTMTAEALLCRILLGWPRTHPALMQGIQELVDNPPDQSASVQSVYYLYYATQVLHHFGGREWQIWNARMKQALPAMQVQSGPEKGSWGPERDMYGRSGGRLYTTCLSIYCLEVYYRHLAIYGIE